MGKRTSLILEGLLFASAFGVLCVLLERAFDMDHIPKYLFGVGTNGRLWHNIVGVIGFSVLSWVVLMAFSIGWQIKYRVKERNEGL